MGVKERTPRWPAALLAFAGMARSSSDVAPLVVRSACCALLALAACHPTQSNAVPDAGSVVDDTPDAGPPLRDPNLAKTLGVHSGAFDVNGSGLLFVIEVDNRLALQLNGQPNLYIGALDGGADAGGFSARLVYPDLEDCGPVTVAGRFTDSSDYQATNVFCANGTPVSGPVVGTRYIGARAYKQNLIWSGAYDAVEFAAPGSACPLDGGSRPLTLGVARDRDGGATAVFVANDGLKEEVVFGSVDDTSGVLSARALDPLGRPTSSLTLFYTVDGGVGGSRSVDLGTAAAPCPAQLRYFGAKR